MGSRGKSALEDYFDHSPILEQELRRKGKDDLLELLKSTNMDSGAIAYIRQHKALGLGHAVWCARRLIGNEPFAVMLPDDVIAAETPCLQQMVEAYEETGGNMVAAMEVPPERASAYGVLDVQEDMGSIVSVKGMVEKPKKDEAPSNLADIGTENTVYGYRFRGQRFDCGSKAGFLQATVAFALERPELREELSLFLHERLSMDQAAQ